MKHTLGSLALVICLTAAPLMAQGPAQPAQAATPTPVAAQPRTLRVAIVDNRAPFETSKDGVFSGLSVDIWREIAATNHWLSDYTSYPTSQAAVDAVAEGKADVAIGPISITKARLQKVSFSLPFFRSGLQVMITDARPHTFVRLLEDLKVWLYAKMLWVVIGIIVLCSVLVALFERKHNPDFPKKWKHGIVEAFYYVITTLIGKSAYKGFPGPLGRLMTVTWMVAGTFLVAYLTSSITTLMTIERLQSHIHGSEDLPGHVIGAQSDSTTIDYLTRHNIQSQGYATLKETVDDLVAGKVDAVVGDAPIIEYFDISHPELPITEVGSVFEPQYYGFATAINSPLIQPIDQSLADLTESRELEKMAQKYLADMYRP